MATKRAKAGKKAISKDAGGAREAGTLIGAACGAAAGVFAGPPGFLIGGAIGTAAGYLAGEVMEEDDARRERRDEILDEEIGVYDGPIGAPARAKHPEFANPARGQGIRARALLRELEIGEQQEAKAPEKKTGTDRKTPRQKEKKS